MTLTPATPASDLPLVEVTTWRGDTCVAVVYSGSSPKLAKICADELLDRLRAYDNSDVDTVRISERLAGAATTRTGAVTTRTDLDARSNARLIADLRDALERSKTAFDALSVRGRL